MRIEAKISSEMPLPIPRFVISSPIHIRSTVPAVSVTMISTSRPGFDGSAPCVVEEIRVPGRLRRREDDGQVPRVLVDLRVARLALFLQLLERSG